MSFPSWPNKCETRHTFARTVLAVQDAQRGKTMKPLSLTKRHKDKEAEWHVGVGHWSGGGCLKGRLSAACRGKYENIFQPPNNPMKPKQMENVLHPSAAAERSRSKFLWLSGSGPTSHPLILSSLPPPPHPQSQTCPSPLANYQVRWLILTAAC